jgi:hypothetical protein
VKKESSKSGYPRPLGGPGASPAKGNQAIMLIHLRPMKGGPKSKSGRMVTGRACKGR